jgi:Transcription factor WhiB
MSEHDLIAALTRVDHGGALCAQIDPDAWFPDKGGIDPEVKRTCLRCPIRFVCLLEAVENGERYGVWGGLSKSQYQALRRQPIQGCEPSPVADLLPPVVVRQRAAIHHAARGATWKRAS